MADSTKNHLDLAAAVAKTAAQGLLAPDTAPVKTYPASWREHQGGAIFLARTESEKLLIAVDADIACQGTAVNTSGHRVGVYPLSAENAAAIRDLFPFARPAKLPADMPSMGFGDRLGSANPGHLRAMRGCRVAPVLAQQSMRELSLTGRSYGQVIDAATWAAVQEGYEGGYGADGDHLKTLDEVRSFLDAGASMITLDLSLVLGTPPGGPCPSDLAAMAGLPLSCDGVELSAHAEDIAQFWQSYGAALDFVSAADALCREKRGRAEYDLEISVDETAHTTKILDHLLLSLELRRWGIEPFSIAPRFPGEFQKGIDYRGDLESFAADTRIHAAIARRFGYKLSVHSGSDKFGVFPTVARLTAGNFHVKTAGTSWLEALRVLAVTEPQLFRRIYAAAHGFFPEAKKYYHIATELVEVPSPAQMADAELPSLLELDASRQFLHIVYGQVLQSPDLGPDLHRVLHMQENTYMDCLVKHFRRHLDDLGLTPG